MSVGLKSVAFGALLVAATLQAHATTFTVTGLVTDNPSVNPAQITDPQLVNPWGVSFAAAGPFWVSDNGTGLSTLYTVNASTNATTKAGLVVTIPPAGSGTPTGQDFNSTTGFNSDLFLFVSEDGTISGWRGALGTTAEVLQAGSAANVYKGSAIATVGGHAYLYGANFRTGTVDVLKGDVSAPSLAGHFADPNLPAGYAPFNIQQLGGKLYVTFAQQDAAKHDEIDGAGKGFVDVFDLNGNFLGRLVSGGALDAPWGLALAPSSFGSVAGDLLVGNFGDGRIDAYDPTNGAFAGALTGANGTPLAIDGLWALTAGNGGNAGSTQQIYFTAGSNGEADGLFGAIAAVPVAEPATVLLLLPALGMLGLLQRRRVTRHC